VACLLGSAASLSAVSGAEEPLCRLFLFSAPQTFWEAAARAAAQLQRVGSAEARG
jgi:hypothetical protein